MKKQLKIKKDESLYKWIERIADNLNFNEELREILRGVSLESYIQGSNASIKVIIKHK